MRSDVVPAGKFVHYERSDGEVRGGLGAELGLTHALAA
jgi:hypothetical protein